MIHRSWKIIGLALLGYVAAMSFIVPLGPGLIDFQRVTTTERLDASPGQDAPFYELIGIGTHWNALNEEQSGQLKCILKHESQLAEVPVVSITDDQHAIVKVDLPDTLPSKSWDVFVIHPIDGTLLLENGLFLEDQTIEENYSWTNPSIEQLESTLTFHFPFQPRIFESIRNLMWHVPMWFTMFVLMGIGFVASIKQLSAQNKTFQFDDQALASVQTGIFFGALGLLTGSLWARYTWGAWWVDDPQLNGALITVMVYAGYLVLRASVQNRRQRAQLSAVYNLFAFTILVILLMVLPRFTESLHPGKGGNPGFNTYDLDSTLRWVFYPAVLGWILWGVWMYRLRLQFNRLDEKLKRILH